MAQVYEHVIFSEQDMHSDNFGLRSPVIQKTVQRKCATSIVERDRSTIILLATATEDKRE